jgi:TRAP-type C4-dicarboxylate transport system substrate-binding protein
MLKWWTVVVVAIVMLAGVSGPGSAADVIELKLGHLSAAGGSEDLAAQKIAEVAQEKSKGRIKVKIFPGGSSETVSQMEAVRSGHRMWCGKSCVARQLYQDYQIWRAIRFKSQEQLDKFMDSPWTRP